MIDNVRNKLLFYHNCSITFISLIASSNSINSILGPLMYSSKCIKREAFYLQSLKLGSYDNICVCV